MRIGDVKGDGENSRKSDWSKIDVSQPNSFVLVAFNPVKRNGYFRLLCIIVSLAFYGMTKKFGSYFLACIVVTLLF